MRYVFAAACLVIALACTPSAPKAEVAGLREGQISAPHHGRDMAYALWYPATPDAVAIPRFGNPVFHPIQIAPDAAPAARRFPLVLLSHGLGGHYRSLGWLATGLAEAGALVQLGAGADRLDATDISAQGSDLTGLLPDATLAQIAPVAHFSVLPLCTGIGAAILQDEGDDPVCTDPDGADRAHIHAQVLTAMREHLGLDER